MKKVFLLYFSLFFLIEAVESRVFSSTSWGSVSIQVNSVETTVSGNKTITTFQIYAPQSLYYKLSFWLMGVKHVNNSYSSYDLRIDNGAVSDHVVTDRGDWYLYSPENFSDVYLTQGNHCISLEGSLDDVPNAELVIGKYGNTNYFPYNSHSMIQDYQLVKAHVSSENQLLIDPFESNYRKIDCFPYEQNSTSPPFYYTAELNKEVYYTFFRKEYYTVNQTVSYETDVIDGVDHVLNVFNPSIPGNCSWSAVSENGHATLSVTIPQTGFYYVLVRTDSDNQWGTCNLTINNDRRFEDIPVGCSRTEIVLPPAYGEYYSCFANSKSGNPIIMLMEDGDVIAYNDDFPYNASLSDFDWGKNARIDGSLSENQWVFTITPTSTKTHKYDIYTGCVKRQTKIWAFPNLKIQDIIRSSDGTNMYNCISWAVGEWMVGLWLSNYDGVTPNPIKYKDALDSIFSAYGYIETTSETAADIDLWRQYNFEIDSLECTHASIRSKGGQYAAGYDWESKLGGGTRIFHPRYALESTLYGEVFTHYKRDEEVSHIWEDTIPFGPPNPFLLNVPLTSQEYERIEYGASHVRGEQMQEFKELYDECEKNGTNKVSISIDTYEMVKPYDQLLKLCKDKPEFNYLLYQKIYNREILAIKLLMDIIKSTDKQLLYDVLSQVEKMRLTMQTTERKVLRTVQADALALVKALLSKEKQSEPIALKEIDFSLSNAGMIDVSVNGREMTIGFDLPSDASVSVLLGTLNGSMMRKLINQCKMSAGQQQVSTIVPSSGIYTIGVVINGSIYKKKVVVQ